MPKGTVSVTTRLGFSVHKNGERFEGEHEDDSEHGRGGTFAWPDGARSDGEYEDDRMNGHGTYTLPNRERYEGNWRDSNKHGRGTFLADWSRFVWGVEG